MSGGVALDRVHLYSRVCAEMLRNLFLCVPLLLLAHVAAAAPVPVPDVEDGICRSETFDDRKKNVPTLVSILVPRSLETVLGDLWNSCRRGSDVKKPDGNN